LLIRYKETDLKTMTAECRRQYRFSSEDRRQLHAEGGSSCQFPGEVCPRPNNGIVHHLTGIMEGWLDHKDPEAISDASMNALLLCNPHAYIHDAQESFQVECLRGERFKNRGTIYERRKHGKRRH
jgi:hypothetical protein